MSAIQSFTLNPLSRALKLLSIAPFLLISEHSLARVVNGATLDIDGTTASDKTEGTTRIVLGVVSTVVGIAAFKSLFSPLKVGGYREGYTGGYRTTRSLSVRYTSRRVARTTPSSRSAGPRASSPSSAQPAQPSSTSGRSSTPSAPPLSPRSSVSGGSSAPSAPSLEPPAYVHPPSYKQAMFESGASLQKDRVAAMSSDIRS